MLRSWQPVGLACHDSVCLLFIDTQFDDEVDSIRFFDYLGRFNEREILGMISDHAGAFYGCT